MAKDPGYKPAPHGDGHKPAFTPKGGTGGNKHGNAPRQDGVNSKGGVNAGEHLWKHSDSEGN